MVNHLVSKKLANACLEMQISLFWNANSFSCTKPVCVSFCPYNRRMYLNYPCGELLPVLCYDPRHTHTHAHTYETALPASAIFSVTNWFKSCVFPDQCYENIILLSLPRSISSSHSVIFNYFSFLFCHVLFEMYLATVSCTLAIQKKTKIYHWQDSIDC